MHVPIPSLHLTSPHRPRLLPFMLLRCRTYATNVFEKQEGGKWVMVLHRGDGRVDAKPPHIHHTGAHPQNGS